jgi:hypothetical protein
LVYSGPYEKKYQQLIKRHGAGFIRNVVECYAQHQCTAIEAAEELGLSVRRVRQLYHDYIQARARGCGSTWQPGCSGGSHHPTWPDQVESLVRTLLGARPPASYSFTASEIHRRFDLVVDRASVRRWALHHQIKKSPPHAVPRVGLRRWQQSRIGALWQLDVSPHPWFPEDAHCYPLFDMLDDCSRLIVGARLYERETLLAYLDFLGRAFQEYGLPLALYVDYHSFFFSHDPDALTYLGRALKFYDISLRYAPTPQAKGKVERLHLFWQNRLPAFCAAEDLQTCTAVNPMLDQLRQHHNRHEVHREIARTPQSAWSQARKEKRSALRRMPRCPWWPYLWSLRKHVVVGSDGRVPAGTQRLRIEVPPHTRVVQCLHPDGTITYLRQEPRQGGKPIVLLQYAPTGKL